MLSNGQILKEKLKKKKPIGIKTSAMSKHLQILTRVETQPHRTSQGGLWCLKLLKPHQVQNGMFPDKLAALEPVSYPYSGKHELFFSSLLKLGGAFVLPACSFCLGYPKGKRLKPLE